MCYHNTLLLITHILIITHHTSHPSANNRYRCACVVGDRREPRGRPQAPRSWGCGGRSPPPKSSTEEEGVEREKGETWVSPNGVVFPSRPTTGVDSTSRKGVSRRRGVEPLRDPVSQEPGKCLAWYEPGCMQPASWASGASPIVLPGFAWCLLGQALTKRSGAPAWNKRLAGSQQKP